MFETERSTDLDDFPTFLYNSMLNSTRVLTKDKRDLTISSTSFISQIWLYSSQLNFVFVCFFFSHTKFDNNIICLWAQVFVKQTKTHHARSRFYPTFKLLRECLSFFGTIVPFQFHSQLVFLAELYAKDMGSFP